MKSNDKRDIHSLSHDARAEIMKNTINRLNIGLWSVNAKTNKVLFISEAVQNIFEMPGHDITPDTWKEHVHPEDLEDVLKRQKQLPSKKRLIHQYRIITPNGNVKWIKDQTVIIEDQKGVIARVIGNIEEITETKVLKEQLHDMAFYDELSKLPNKNLGRKVLFQLIEEHHKVNKSFVLFYINIDDFVNISYTFSTETKEAIIKELSLRIEGFACHNGNIVHLAEDTWIVTVNYYEDQEKNVDQFSMDLIEVIGQPIDVNGLTFYQTASIGVSVFPRDGMENKILVKNAHSSMITAKKLGKANYHVFSPSLSEFKDNAFQLKNDLRMAIQNEELYLEYQPKVDGTTQKPIGAEALIRWKHSTCGDVSPGEFIPVAENGPLIQQIGSFVISSVCKQVADWQRKGLTFDKISFNLSAKDFFRKDLIDQVQFCIQKYGVNPNLLEIEVTEGALLTFTEMVQDQIKKLRELGIQIALDDYGTGYSSINYLRQYPVETIKIDQSFIQKITYSSEDVIIVKSIIELSKGLNKIVVAEGVETIEQFQILKKMGCDLVQGFLFSRSISADRMEHLFELGRLEPQI